MDRARTVRPVGRLGEGAGRQGPPRLFLALGRDAGRVGPAGRNAVQAVLLDGLRGPRVVELRRPVGRADDERHAGMVGLDDRRMELGGSRAARHADDRRPPRRHRQSQREEPGAALVEADVDPESISQGQSQRCRTRAGTDHGVGDAEVDPLVDESGAEGGLYAHAACPSMPKCAVPGRRWSCCTGSRRPGASGAASVTSWPSLTHWSRWICRDTAVRGRCAPTWGRQRASWRRQHEPSSAMSPARCSATRWVPGWHCRWRSVRTCPCAESSSSV